MTPDQAKKFYGVKSDGWRVPCHSSDTVHCPLYDKAFGRTCTFDGAPMDGKEECWSAIAHEMTAMNELLEAYCDSRSDINPKNQCAQCAIESICSSIGGMFDVCGNEAEMKQAYQIVQALNGAYKSDVQPQVIVSHEDKPKKFNADPTRFFSSDAVYSYYLISAFQALVGGDDETADHFISLCRNMENSKEER